MCKGIRIILLFIFILNISAESINYKETDLGIKTIIDSLEVEVQFYNSSTVRIIKKHADKTLYKKSLSVIEVPKKTQFTVVENENELLLKSENLLVKLNVTQGAISFFTINEKPLLNEKVKGVEFTEFNDAGVNTWSVKQSFLLDKDEAIYGLGQQQQGKMVQRNLALRMIQGNTDDYVPFFVSVKGYGLFWDNYSPTTFWIMKMKLLSHQM